MHSKKALIRAITRFLYAGGFVFLILGMLLSAVSSSVLAAGGPPTGSLQNATQTLSVKSAAIGTATTAAGATQTAVCLLCRTVTPRVTNPTATHTPVPGQPSNTPAPTHAPMLVNLSNICGYPSDKTTMWKVANHSGSDVNYVWRVVNSSETGSGTVRANSDDYFTTRSGVTVRLYVGNELVDTEGCLAPCKQELQLAYTCTESGLTWSATNPNDFPVSYTVRVDNQETGRGAIPAGSTVKVASSTSGAHSVELTWTDTRPGTHTVRLDSPANSCVHTTTVTPTITPTFTPTMTLTPQFQEITFTPTFTATPTAPVDITPTFTFTPTVTPTSPVVITSTFTPTPTTVFTTPVVVTVVVTSTFTATPTTTLTSQPQIIPSFTPTVTNTATQGPSPTFTQTPTSTQTLPPLGGFIPSATPIGTLAPPASTITSTPVLIPVTGVDLTLPIGANSLSIFGSLLTNVGLFTLGLALMLTGISSQMKK